MMPMTMMMFIFMMRMEGKAERTKASKNGEIKTVATTIMRNSADDGDDHTDDGMIKLMMWKMKECGDDHTDDEDDRTDHEDDHIYDVEDQMELGGRHRFVVMTMMWRMMSGSVL